MRTASVVLSTVACASGSRQFQASSKAVFMSVTEQVEVATERLPLIICEAAIRRAAIGYPYAICRITYDGKMNWGQASALFGLTCFGAIVLFMVLREPNT
jgi:hypothetical protein